jgi:hypothetical protein
MFSWYFQIQKQHILITLVRILKLWILHAVTIKVVSLIVEFFVWLFQALSKSISVSFYSLGGTPHICLVCESSLILTLLDTYYKVVIKWFFYVNDFFIKCTF